MVKSVDSKVSSVSFPAYVPKAVRTHIEKLIDGDDNGFNGWAAAANEPGNEWIASIVFFLRRFQIMDERIKQMFRYLDASGLSESSQKDFVNAAWLSLTDYAKYRDTLKDADKQRKAIAKQAKELATLLRGITDHGLIGVPMEFYSVRTLLCETNGDDQLWPIMREKLLPLPGESEAGGLDYIWGIAPKVPDLLDTVAKVAVEYQPQFGGRIGAAINMNQFSPRTEFIRAFGHELIGAGIPLTESSVLPSMTINVRPRSKSTPAKTVAYSVRKAMAELSMVALGGTIREREIAQQFPDIKPLTQPQQNTRVIRFD